MRFLRRIATTVMVATVALAANSAQAQSFGVELNNTLMPASGGMGGTSIAEPQDLLSAINGNAGSLSQFEGTQFTFSGAWADPSIHFTQTASLPVSGVDPYTGASSTPGAAVGNIGVTQNFESYGKPVTIGLALISNAGAGVDFRTIPQSNGTSAELLILEFVGAMSVQMTERLSAGATVAVGEGFYDAPFAGIGAMTPAYGLRGSVGLDYQLNSTTKLGTYYQSRQDFNFKNAILLAPTFAPFDVRMSMPDNIGVGISNTSLMDGKLLLAADILFKEWDNANLYKNVYKNQWVFQTGAQYSTGKYRYRLGYVYAENPVVPITDVVVSGIPVPDAVPGANYLQAQVAVFNQHRVSAGLGIVDILPGLSFDAFAGGMFHASQQLGPSTNVSASSYYLGAGLTWKFCNCGAMRSASADE